MRLGINLKGVKKNPPEAGGWWRVLVSPLFEDMIEQQWNCNTDDGAYDGEDDRFDNVGEVDAGKYTTYYPACETDACVGW